MEKIQDTELEKLQKKEPEETEQKKPQDTEQDRAHEIERHIRAILRLIGDDADREGLRGTPGRVARMYGEIFRGYDESQRPHITTFPNGADGVVCKNMVVDEGTFHSMCEHHMMPFFGKYCFAYIPHPEGRILGISKIGRAVDYCAARLQIQERLGQEIVSMLAEALGTEHPPLGMAIAMRGEHLCKSMRGVKKQGVMLSSYFTGAFETDPTLQERFERIAMAQL